MFYAVFYDRVLQAEGEALTPDDGRVARGGREPQNE